MTIVRKINGLRIVWTDPDDDGVMEPMVNIMGTIKDDVESTSSNVSWTFLERDLAPSEQAKLNAFLADVLGHAQGKLGAGRPVSLPR